MKYTIKENGLVVAEVPNLITTAGKKAILYSFANAIRPIGSLCVGVGDVSPSISDQRLSFEIGRYSVNVCSPDYTNSAIVFKATLPSELGGYINEVGAWASRDDRGVSNGNLLVGFTQGDSWSVGTWNTADARVGTEALSISANASQTVTSVLTGIFLDMSTLKPTDPISIAGKFDSNLSQIVIRFISTTGNYYSATLNSLGTGYKVVNTTKSSFTSTGSPSWSSITSVEIAVTATGGGSTVVVMDGIRVDNRNFQSSENILISHAVLGASAFYKRIGVPVDIEYSLAMTL